MSKTTITNVIIRKKQNEFDDNNKLVTVIYHTEMYDKLMRLIGKCIKAGGYVELTINRIDVEGVYETADCVLTQ